jgi:integrase
MATTGLRIGEALGLGWDDVNTEARTLRVRRAIQRQTGKGLVFIEPKSAQSRRTIDLTQTAIEALHKHRTSQLESRLQLGVRWRNHDMVFCSQVGTPLDPMNTYHRFQKALQESGLPRMRQHDLRHTAATLMLSEGIHPRIVQEMMGHSSITLTLATYSHVMPTLQREAAEKLEAAFARERSRADTGSAS